MVLFTDGSTVIFQGNTATKVGGAFFIQSSLQSRTSFHCSLIYTYAYSNGHHSKPRLICLTSNISTTILLRLNCLHDFLASSLNTTNIGGPLKWLFALDNRSSNHRHADSWVFIHSQSSADTFHKMIATNTRLLVQQEILSSDLVYPCLKKFLVSQWKTMEGQILLSIRSIRTTRYKADMNHS